MPANYAAEDFPGQSALINIIRAAEAYRAAQPQPTGVRRADPIVLSDQYLRTLSAAELRRQAGVISGKYLSEPSEDHSTYWPRNAGQGYVPSGVKGTGANTRWSRFDA